MQQHKVIGGIRSKLNSKLFQNSAWGVIANILQNVLLSVFFIVIAREYSKSDFANYVIANTVYSFVVGFSALGLGHWFIRELINTENKKELVDKFFKIQLYAGVVFYVINIILSYSLYESDLVRSLSVIIGINIIFDNIIYVIKYINVAQLEQKKSFVILTIEALLKFLIACLLFFKQIDIVYLSFFLILLRLITLNLFIRFGSSNEISLKKILQVKVPFSEVKKIVGANWSFIIIGSISVIYWRIGNILVSKVLELSDVATYEISYKLLSIGYILPVIVSSTIYPMLLNAYKEGMDKMQNLYKKAFIPFSLYGLLSYTFIYSFADLVIPLLFTDKYEGVSFYCKEMFLVMLTFPTVFLQANVLITLKLEKLDMICNAASLVLNVLLCAIGFYFYKSLSVVNYAIFFSFLAFHIIQDVVLIRKKVVHLSHVLGFYIISAVIVLLYLLLAEYIQKEYLFFIFWGGAGIMVALLFWYKKKSNKPWLFGSGTGKNNSE